MWCSSTSGHINSIIEEWNGVNCGVLIFVDRKECTNKPQGSSLNEIILYNRSVIH